MRESDWFFGFYFIAHLSGYLFYCHEQEEINVTLASLELHGKTLTISMTLNIEFGI